MTNPTPEPPEGQTPATVDRWTRLAAQLCPDTMWHHLDVVERTGSTNADLIAAAARPDRPLAPGSVLVAHHQDAGRGRFDRVWVAPAGASVAMSMLVAPTQPVTRWAWLSVAAGMAVRSGIIRATGADPDRVTLKWPNDALLDGLKISGNLVEQAAIPHGPRAVVGIGINVSLTREQLPIAAATSLTLAGLPVDPVTLAAAVLDDYQRLYERWSATGTLLDDYRAQLATLGRRVRVLLSSRVITGTAVDIDQTGALVVATDADVRQTFAAGDVQHLR